MDYGAPSDEDPSQVPRFVKFSLYIVRKYELALFKSRNLNNWDFFEAPIAPCECGCAFVSLSQNFPTSEA